MTKAVPLIKTTNLRKQYADARNDTVALEGLALKVDQGESLAIVGPSGSGKTTLLQLIGGLDAPTSGTVEVLGRNLGSLNDRELSEFRNHTIGFIFQFFNLQSYFTAVENVALPLLLGGEKRKNALDSAEDLLRRVGLAERLHHLPSQLSGGEMQRVAIARALVVKPKLILADEPTANLDAQNSQSVLDMLQQIGAAGTSVIIITHDPGVAKLFPNQLHLNKGRAI